MDLQTWYGTGIRVPNQRTTLHYPMFLANTMGLVRTIVSRKLEREVSVRFGNVATASMDHDNNRINISNDFYKGVFTENALPLDVPTTITAILGVTIHELAHLAWSPKTLEPWAEHIKKRTSVSFNAEMAMSVGNLVEDVYIEARLSREISSLTWMVDCINDVMWTEEERNERVSKALKLSKHPKTQDEVTTLYNMGLLVKVGDWNVNPFVDDFLSLVAEARDDLSLEDRLELGLRVYEYLVKDLSPERNNDNLAKKMDPSGITADHSEEEGKKQITQSSQTEVVNRQMEKIEKQLLTVSEGDSDTVLYNELGITGGHKPRYPIEVNQQYSLLGQLARQIATVNRPYGQQRERGHSIRNLYRIGTDQKIFADAMKVEHQKPMQVAILVDCSGSMKWNDAGASTQNMPNSRIYRALSACLGAAESLANYQAAVSVWGHTADVEQKYTTTIFRFKSWHDSIASLKAKAELFLGNISWGEYMVSGNRDGDAVNYVGKKFSSVGTRKLLIVISDGFPNAEMYSGEKADTHTQGKVNELRSQGVSVLSISISEEARKANDFIYGKEFNVCNSDPNVIASIVQSLILSGEKVR